MEHLHWNILNNKFILWFLLLFSSMGLSHNEMDKLNHEVVIFRNYPLKSFSALESAQYEHRMETNDGIFYYLDFVYIEKTTADFLIQNFDTKELIALGNPSPSQFPLGIADTQGYINIQKQGYYSVHFNRISKIYSFIPYSAKKHRTISIIGNADIHHNDVLMHTKDSIHYELKQHPLAVGSLQFREDLQWNKVWGSSDFPEGTGTINGEPIQISEEGFYDITFEITTGKYTFTKSTIKNIPEIRLSFVKWSNNKSITLKSNDGINYWGNGIFSWPNNKFSIDYIGIFFVINNVNFDYFSGKNFPEGRAAMYGANQPIIPPTGEYDIFFNRISGNYRLERKNNVFQDISIKFEIDGSTVAEQYLTTKDGIQYELQDVFLEECEAYFESGFPESIPIGGSHFPSGKAVKSNNKIAVPEGYYTLLLNTMTETYDFISLKNKWKINGSAIIDFENHTTMHSEDGVVYSYDAIKLQPGKFSFIELKNWWSNTYYGPSGYEGIAESETNTFFQIDQEKEYQITLNIESMEYSIIPLENNRTNINQSQEFTFYPNPFQNTLNLSGIDLGNEVIINFYSVAGNLVHSNYNPTSTELDVSRLPDGLYIVHVTVNGETTVTKLVKK